MREGKGVREIDGSTAYLDTPGNAFLLKSSVFLTADGRGQHGAFRVSNQSIHFRVLVDGLEDGVEGLLGAAGVEDLVVFFLEQAQSGLGRQTTGNMPHTSENLKGIAAVAAGAVDEAVDGTGAEVVLPTGRRVHLVHSLGVGEVGQASVLHVLGKGSQLDAKVLFPGVTVSHPSSTK